MTESTPRSYETIPELAGVYLEDSYVLDVHAAEHSVQFDLDLVLTPQHPAYHDPRPGEQYCYRRGRILIAGARSVRWVRRAMQAFRDASGEVDYGSIDSWYLDGEISHIAGDWGELEVDNGEVKVVLEPEDADDPASSRAAE
ncbi:MAG TPA: hypothetical protein VG186_13950 [Solirubrobacteraceae bacterium]|nr:hypothetical protein [Solirubrobacteraceae bacterium]